MNGMKTQKTAQQITQAIAGIVKGEAQRSFETAKRQVTGDASFEKSNVSLGDEASPDGVYVSNLANLVSTGAMDLQQLKAQEQQKMGQLRAALQRIKLEEQQAAYQKQKEQQEYQKRAAEQMEATAKPKEEKKGIFAKIGKVFRGFRTAGERKRASIGPEFRGKGKN